MGNDSLLTELVGGGFLLLQIGLVAWLLLRLRRRARTFPCPVCGKAIARDRLAVDGVACPHCPWEVKAPSRPGPGRNKPAASTMVETEGECPCCEHALIGQVAVPLWDGRKYCRACVEHACPGLADYAEGHDSFEETMPYSAWGVAARVAGLATIVGGTFFGVPYVVWAWNQGNGLADFPFAGLFTFLGVFLLPVVLLFATGAGLTFVYIRPTVKVRGGRVIVQPGNSAARDYALADCAWFPGTTWQDSPFVPRRPAVLLVLPEHPDAPYTGYQAVGFTEPTRRAWTAFLTLAGVPRRLPEGRPRTWFHDIRDGVLALLLFPVSFGLGAVMGLVVGVAVLWLTGDLDLASVLGGLSFLFGGVTLIFYAPMLWSWRTGDPGETRTAHKRREKTKLSGWRILGLTAILLLVFGLPLLLWNEVSWRARWAGFLFILVWAWLFFKGLEYLAAAREKRMKNDPASPDETRSDSREP